MIILSQICQHFLENRSHTMKLSCFEFWRPL